ncbi:MAG TPA: hypothetical protein VFP47_16635 [Pyrinomonadaceae bacterium]|jgi:hypothetical protein|nr:hypothetical protein [Pyrinomonadaceae bacterium]
MKAEALDRVTDLSGAAAQLEAGAGVGRVKEAVVAVLKVSGIKWNDLGEPRRVLLSVPTAGVRPRWVEQC